MPKTEIIIVNFRTPRLTRDCIASVIEYVLPEADAHITVTDNDSGDGSIEYLRNSIEYFGWSEHVTLMPLSRNGGFAFGNNAAIEMTLRDPRPPEYLWLLNPDTVVREGSLKRLLDRIQQNEHIGIVGSRLENLDATPQRSAFRFPSIASEFDLGLRIGVISRLLNRYVVAPPVADHAIETGWVAGASMLVRREVFEDIGLLDEDYFMYYEEVDFCLAAKRAGWRCWYEPASRVVHLVGQASGVTDNRRSAKRRPKYWFDSRRRYFIKNHGWLYAAVIDLVWTIGYFLFWLRSFASTKSHNDPPYFLRDSIRNSFVIRGFSL